MDKDSIEDFKQFISTTTSQQLALQTEEIDKKFSSLENKIDDLSASIGEAIDTSNSEHEKRLDNHEQRLTKLETVTG